MPTRSPPTVGCSGVLLQQVHLSVLTISFSLSAGTSHQCAAAAPVLNESTRTALLVLQLPPSPIVSALLRGTPGKEQLPRCLHFFISPSLSHPLQCGPLWDALETTVALATGKLHDAESIAGAQASPAFLSSVGHSVPPPPSFSHFPGLTHGGLCRSSWLVTTIFLGLQRVGDSACGSVSRLLRA